MSRLAISLFLLLVLSTITLTMGNAVPNSQQPKMKFKPMIDIKNLPQMSLAELDAKYAAKMAAKAKDIPVRHLEIDPSKSEDAVPN